VKKEVLNDFASGFKTITDQSASLLQSHLGDICRSRVNRESKRYVVFLVLDAEGELIGILSMNDVLFKVKEPSGKKTPQLTFADVVKTYLGICERPAEVQM
jgi:CBS domain-containing protein